MFLPDHKYCVGIKRNRQAVWNGIWAISTRFNILMAACAWQVFRRLMGMCLTRIKLFIYDSKETSQKFYSQRTENQNDRKLTDSEEGNWHPDALLAGMGTQEIFEKSNFPIGRSLNNCLISVTQRVDLQALLSGAGCTVEQLRALAAW